MIEAFGYILTAAISAIVAGLSCYRWGQSGGRADGYADGYSDARAGRDPQPQGGGGPGNPEK